MSSDNKKSKYWICYECAAGKDMILATTLVGTPVRGRCGHCDGKEETVMFVTFDYVRGNKMTALARQNIFKSKSEEELHDILDGLYNKT